MNRQWAWVLFSAGCALACGGRAETGEQDPDTGTPPAGFYAVTWQTVTDSCQPIRQQGTSEELIGTTASLVSIVLGPTGHGHQEIKWDEPFFYAAKECGLTLSFEVAAKRSQSFVVDGQVDWTDPSTACSSWRSFGIPDAPCSVHQIASYELEQACPTTRNGVSCN